MLEEEAAVDAVRMRMRIKGGRGARPRLHTAYPATRAETLGSFETVAHALLQIIHDFEMKPCQSDIFSQLSATRPRIVAVGSRGREVETVFSIECLASLSNPRMARRWENVVLSRSRITRNSAEMGGTINYSM